MGQGNPVERMTRKELKAKVDDFLEEMAQSPCSCRDYIGAMVYARTRVTDCIVWAQRDEADE